ncbi:hypothetical protein, partial [Pseudonocardia abyssalis]|uniref:hypothetical protein n=1 Tax=Pseudonocardia abyssalis TaxID=2792008 RepID=UPI001C4A085E
MSPHPKASQQARTTCGAVFWVVVTGRASRRAAAVSGRRTAYFSADLDRQLGRAVVRDAAGRCAVH